MFYIDLLKEAINNRGGAQYFASGDGNVSGGRQRRRGEGARRAGPSRGSARITSACSDLFLGRPWRLSIPALAIFGWLKTDPLPKASVSVLDDSKQSAWAHYCLHPMRHMVVCIVVGAVK